MEKYYFVPRSYPYTKSLLTSIIHIIGRRRQQQSPCISTPHRNHRGRADIVGVARGVFCDTSAEQKLPPFLRTNHGGHIDDDNNSLIAYECPRLHTLMTFRDNGDVINGGSDGCDRCCRRALLS